MKNSAFTEMKANEMMDVNGGTILAPVYMIIKWVQNLCKDEKGGYGGASSPKGGSGFGGANGGGGR